MVFNEFIVTLVCAIMNIDFFNLLWLYWYVPIGTYSVSEALVSDLIALSIYTTKYTDFFGNCILSFLQFIIGLLQLFSAKAVLETRLLMLRRDKVGCTPLPFRPVWCHGAWCPPLKLCSEVFSHD